jgi:TolB-like protein
LASRTFAKTEILRGLLAFLVRNAITPGSAPVTEVCLGIQVLKRGTAFNPLEDSIVRKTMGRLREKLDAYYSGEGRAAAVRIVLERGSYRPVFLPREDSRVPGYSGRGPRILLLPFNPVNFHDSGFFTDGLFEDLMIALSAGVGVSLVPWTTAHYLREKTGDVREYHRLTEADIILDGTVRRLGDSLFQITLSWVEGLTAVFNSYLQVRTQQSDTSEAIRDLCEQIAQRLGLKFAAEAQNQIVPRQSAHPEARALFLRARQANRLGTREGTRTSFAYLSRALDLQPNYAAAHALMADAHIFAAIAGMGPPKREMQLAIGSVDNALQLAPRLAIALAAKGGTQFAFQWEFAAAAKSLLEARFLDPTSDSTHFWSEAVSAAQNGSGPAALLMEDHAQADNCSAPTAYLASSYCYNDRQWKRTEYWARRSIELDPTYFRPYPFLAGAYLELGRWDEALNIAETARRLSGPNTYSTGMLGIVLSRTGRHSEARAVLEDYNLIEGFRSSLGRAVILAEMGESNQALDTIEQMIEDREAYVAWLHVFPFFQNLHAHPRFQALLAQRGF